MPDDSSKPITGRTLRAGYFSSRPNWLRLIPHSILPLAARELYLALFNHLGENDHCFPPIECLMLDTGVSRDTIANSINKLVKYGLAKVTKRRHLPNKNEYQLFEPAILVEADEWITKTQRATNRDEIPWEDLEAMRREAVDEWLESLNHRKATRRPTPKRRLQSTTEQSSVIVREADDCDQQQPSAIVREADDCDQQQPSTIVREADEQSSEKQTNNRPKSRRTIVRRADEQSSEEQTGTNPRTNPEELPQRPNPLSNSERETEEQAPSPGQEGQTDYEKIKKVWEANRGPIPENDLILCESKAQNLRLVVADETLTLAVREANTFPDLLAGPTVLADQEAPPLPRKGLGADEKVGSRTNRSERKGSERKGLRGGAAAQPPAACETPNGPGPGAVLDAGKPATTNPATRTTTMETTPDRFVRLGEAWKKAHDQAPSLFRPLPTDRQTLATCYHLMSEQESKIKKDLDPEKIIRTIGGKYDEPCVFEDLFKESGTSFVWYKLMRGQRPTTTKRKTPTQAEIDSIYDAYPKKVGKGAAHNEIKNSIRLLLEDKPDLPIEEHVAWLLERTKLYAASAAGNKGQYTPNPERWFGEQRWADDEREWRGADAAGGKLEYGVNEYSTPADFKPRTLEEEKEFLDRFAATL